MHGRGWMQARARGDAETLTIGVGEIGKHDAARSPQSHTDGGNGTDARDAGGGVSWQAGRAARLPAHPAVASTRAQREARRALNEAVDRALLGSAPERQRMLELGRREDAAPLADRVRLRAMRLAKSHAAHCGQILTGAESLVLAVYRHAIPRGWMCGFCDASVAAYDDGRTVARISSSPALPRATARCRSARLPRPLSAGC